MRSALLLCVPVLALACSKNTPVPTQTPASAAPSAVASVAAPMVHGAASEPGAVPVATNAAAPVQGKVAERIEAVGYSYLRLTTATGDVWAAVPETTTPVGTDVTIASPMPMRAFESKTLNRKFDLIYFGTIAGEAPAPGAASAGMAAPVPGMGSDPAHGPTATPPADLGPIKVAKAEGPDARTVAELFGQKAALKDKNVVVRGKVVKFTGGVMKSNWVHLRDGSGTDATKDNDVTVRTADTVAVGDEVVAKGVVHVDRDFGAGYFYPVIIEDATVAK